MVLNTIHRTVLIFILSAVFCICCSIQNPAIQSAELYPLYIYNPQNSDTSLFAALRINIENGSTDIRTIRLESMSQDLYWEVDFTENEDELLRAPSEEDDEVDSPSFASDNAGADSEFGYMWFFSLSDNVIPNGSYMLTISDFSGERLTQLVNFEGLNEDEFTELSEHLASLNPFQRIESGSYEVINFIEDNLPEYNLRMESESFRSYIDANGLDIQETLEQLYLWGVPAGIDILVLAGPFF